ncbi:HlyD family efflux transporter periplasmic adaptor subunit [Streptomyces sp. NBC_01190]|uniref:HlyD family efflux transporter periplasmic adaptor subunit n=1 Tax=Streptomyces sp. NBC_01190 TaxID=2903767 RepID=UPI0038663F6B|nr:HlyD family efflux transporter periplasmic adaptor subunit [Streptomyces sp. NBC_01190]
MKFRPQALARLQSPTALDAPIQLARPRTLFSLSVVALLLVSGAFWAVTGAIPRQTQAAGILTHAEGSIHLQSPYAGQITGVFVSTGSVFLAHTPLFTIESDGHSQTVRSITGGRIISVLGSVGQVVTAGTELAVIERIDESHDPLVAVVYLPQASAGLVRVGSQVDLSVASAPAAQFGVLRGTVQAIGQFPQTEAQISNFLGDPQLASTFSAQGQPLGVTVRITPGRTTSGFSWSKSSGPPFQVDSRTLVTAAIHLPPIKPVDWVVS